jgi:hypothetical protein
MSTHRKILVATFLTLLVAAALPAAASDAFSFRVEGAFVVGDQVYDGGDLELTRVGRGGLMALRVNGRHLGLLRTRDYGPPLADATPYLVFRKVGTAGLWRLHEVRLRAEDSNRVRVVRIDPVDLLPGFATLPSAGESTALATR